ncbi:hypothetical protein GC093_16860 [Paenibacillus sp. LMG 31456]|uniref:Uncharacterized protein n=1 Tax=Paenibacillus foliorum TaxID=2654974 RepID=A0A972GQA8_9BACL|nr:hypothetical protein [Paenibacillus foliorum]NOU94879.1 hypothetical protein [Paenibacillus foliorum]
MIFDQDWIKETVITRFDELAGIAEQLEVVARLIDQAAILEKHLNYVLDRTNQLCVKDLLDLSTQHCAMQKEWLYMKGVQDGMKLLYFMKGKEINPNAEEIVGT